MRPLPLIRVLVVEDDDEWRTALCAMYEELLRRTAVVRCTPASSVGEAVRLLGTQSFDLLSLDIRLADRPGAGEAASGRTVLRVAAENRSCTAAIAITGCQHDEKLDVVLPGEARAIRMGLDAYMQRLFSSRRLVLHKEPGQTLEENIIRLRGELQEQEVDLVRLCDVVDVLERRESSWFLRFNHKTVALPDVTGMVYLAELLRHQDTPDGVGCRALDALTVAPSGVAELATATANGETIDEKTARDIAADFAVDNPSSGDGALDESPDPGAVAAAKQELLRLEHEITMVKNGVKEGKLRALRKEAKLIREYIEEGSKHRRPRESKADKQIRDRVCRAINTAIDAIAERCPAAGKHFRKAIRTGSSCRYVPGERVSWRVRS